MAAPFRAIEIEINHACNRRCSYCPNSIATRKNTGVIDPLLYTKLMQELKTLSFEGRVSYHFYNEPLLHPDFEGIVRQTREALPKAAIVLYTNGVLLSKERLEKLLALGVDEFLVTRHEEDQDYAFEQTYRSLLPHIRKHVTYKDYRELNLTNRGGMLNFGKGLSLAPCYIPSMIATVTVSGNVLPCFEDYEETLVMGNLGEQSLMEIWNSEKFSQFRKNLRLGQRHLYGPCKDCSRFESLPTERP